MSDAQKITTQTTKKMASLSRIRSNPSDDFLEINTQNLNGILDYIKEIQSVDTGNISPTDIKLKGKELLLISLKNRVLY
jgi:Asp-tRNA(Asn)/Glu-tRNA(Gln) amidotransferase C subunit